MNKYSVEALLHSLPYALEKTQAIKMMAQVVAEELIKLMHDNDLLNIYAHIDELPGELLDILARDFSVEWWDGNATLEAKRKTFKSCMAVHRKIGTAGAVKTALASAYEGATVHEYGEDSELMPYHYAVNVVLDGFGSSDKTDDIIRRTKIYGNVRSRLDGVTFSTEIERPLYAGCGLSSNTVAQYTVGME